MKVMPCMFHPFATLCLRRFISVAYFLCFLPVLAAVLSGPSFLHSDVL